VKASTQIKGDHFLFLQFLSVSFTLESAAERLASSIEKESDTEKKLTSSTF
jgi:hypothetical protein